MPWAFISQGAYGRSQLKGEDNKSDKPGLTEKLVTPFWLGEAHEVERGAQWVLPVETGDVRTPPPRSSPSSPNSASVSLPASESATRILESREICEEYATATPTFAK